MTDPSPTENKLTRWAPDIATDGAVWMKRSGIGDYVVFADVQRLLGAERQQATAQQGVLEREVAHWQAIVRGYRSSDALAADLAKARAEVASLTQQLTQLKEENQNLYKDIRALSL